jgi:hypothetical protein
MYKPGRCQGFNHFIIRKNLFMERFLRVRIHANKIDIVGQEQQASGVRSPQNPAKLASS